MAATTISAIIERIETVLAAEPLALTLNPDPFTDEGIPNQSVNDTVRVTSGGVVNSRSTSNYQAIRLDRVTVTLQRSMGFNGYEAQRDLQEVLDDIERQIIADGPDHGYSVTVEKGSRKIERKKESDVISASLHFLVDYDFSEAV
jgi:hypothetical protein